MRRQSPADRRSARSETERGTLRQRAVLLPRRHPQPRHSERSEELCAIGLSYSRANTHSPVIPSAARNLSYGLPACFFPEVAGCMALELFTFPTVRYLRILSSRFLPMPRIASRSSTLLNAPYDFRILRIFSAVAGPIPGTCCSSAEVAVFRFTGSGGGFFVVEKVAAEKAAERKRKKKRGQFAGVRRSITDI